VLPSEKADIILKWKYQCCGSGMFMFIPDPDFCPSRIPYLGSKTSNKRGLKKKLFYLFCSNNNHKIELSTQKIVKKLSKIWVWGSGIRKKPIPDPGSRVHAPDPGSGYVIL
jgi:hypothetical protein